MKYKVGDNVRIKELDEIKRKNPHLGYNYAMIQYEGQIHQIVEVDDYREQYKIKFPNEIRGRSHWFYKEEWLEDPVEFEAF